MVCNLNKLTTGKLNYYYLRLYTIQARDEKDAINKHLSLSQLNNFVTFYQLWVNAFKVLRVFTSIISYSYVDTHMLCYIYNKTILKTDQTFMYTTSLLYLSSRLNKKDIDFLNIKFEFRSWHPLLYTSKMFVHIRWAFLFTFIYTLPNRCHYRYASSLFFSFKFLVSFLGWL